MEWFSVLVQLVVIAAAVHYSIVLKGALDRRYGSRPVLQVSLIAVALLAVVVTWRLMVA